MSGVGAVTRVVNASVLLELPAVTVLTDPYFDDHWYLPMSEPVGLAAGDLPELDVILGGHRVADHWQPRSLRPSGRGTTTPVFVPARGMARAARRAGFESVEVLQWGDRRSIGRGVEVTCVPGERVTGMRTNAYVVATPDLTVYISTEARGLDAIRAASGEHDVDVAALPVNGARLLGHRLVMDAPTAVEAACILGASVLVPIHHSQRPVPGLLTCPTGVDAVHVAAGGTGLTVVTAPTGVRVSLPPGRGAGGAAQAS